jgi:hypothetical protein
MHPSAEFIQGRKNMPPSKPKKQPILMKCPVGCSEQFVFSLINQYI